MNYNTTNSKIGDITKATYVSRPAWNETHTKERTAIRHARIMRRKNIVENIKWSFIMFAMGLAVVFAPMVNYIF